MDESIMPKGSDCISVLSSSLQQHYDFSVPFTTHYIVYVHTLWPWAGQQCVAVIGCKRRGGVVLLTPDVRMLAFLPATWSPATAI